MQNDSSLSRRNALLNWNGFVPVHHDLDRTKKRTPIMLMLSRKADQSITLRIPGHENVVIKIVDLKKNEFGKLTARVGIDASREIEIVRNEIIGTASDCPKVKTFS